MTISIKHAFQSLKANSADATRVRPTNWNAEHEMTVGASVVLGRDGSGAGAVTELPVQFDADRDNVAFGSGTGSLKVMSGTTVQEPGSPAVGMVRYDTTLSKLRAYIAAAWASLATETFVTAAVVAAQGTFSQCRLTKSGANLLLSRFNGSKLTINGANESIPSAGVTLAPTSATPDTTYYIYAFMNAGVMTLEYSATAPATHIDGTQIKTADATRALVGMARAITGPAWVDTEAQRFVISYYNRRSIAGKNAFTADQTTTSNSYDEIGNFKVEFLTWADEAVALSCNGSVSNTNATTDTHTSIGVDDDTAEDSMAAVINYFAGAITPIPFAVQVYASYAEGYHEAHVIGKASANTGTWVGGTSGNRTSIRALVRG